MYVREVVDGMLVVIENPCPLQFHFLSICLILFYLMYECFRMCDGMMNWRGMDVMAKLRR